MSAEIRIGTSGWSFADWKGIVYPADAPRSFRELAYLATFFDAVEINTSFYRPPAPRFAEHWLRDVAGNERFRFTLKLWQRFTHPPAGGQDWTEKDVAFFMDAIRPLTDSGRLGAVLIQYPWSFRHTHDNAVALRRVADAFAALPLVVELRHASWNNDTVLGWLRGHAIGFCNIDQPVRRLADSAITGTNYITGPVAYYRLHGRNREAWFKHDAGRDERYNYLYSAAELDPWIARLRAAREEAEEIYVMANNHFRGQAPVNALQMRAALAGEPVRVPPSLIEYYPVLRPIARVDERSARPPARPPAVGQAGPPPAG